MTLTRPSLTMQLASGMTPRLRACVGKMWTLRATIATIFSHMTRDVSVFVKCIQFLDCFNLITTNANF